MRRAQAIRVKRALDYVKNRLRLDLEFVVSPGAVGEQVGVLDIQRSFRGTEVGIRALVDAGFTPGEAARAFPEDFPLLSEMGTEMAETMGGDEQFEYGLDVVIAGIAAARSGR